jgi:hypothetical protein
MARDNATDAVTAEDADGEAQGAFPWCPDSPKRRAQHGPQRTKTLTEIDLHRSVAQFLDWCLEPPALYTTFPAGWDKMSKSRAGMLYGAGLKAGMPDILIFYNGFTLGLELKTAKGKLSTIQKKMHELLTNAGVFVHVCRSVDEVESILRELKISLRGTVQAA